MLPKQLKQILKGKKMIRLFFWNEKWDSYNKLQYFYRLFIIGTFYFKYIKPHN